MWSMLVPWADFNGVWFDCALEVLGIMVYRDF